MAEPHIVATVDLHGLTWKRASIVVSNSLYRAQIKANQGGPATEKRPVTIQIITGVGKHSNAGPVLRQNVRSLLMARGYQYSEKHGAFHVVVPPTPRGARSPPSGATGGRGATERNRVNMVSRSSAEVMRACQPHHQQRRGGGYAELVGGGGGRLVGEEPSTGAGTLWPGEADPLPRDTITEQQQRERQRLRQRQRQRQRQGQRQLDEDSAHNGSSAVEAELAFEEALEASAREEDERCQRLLAMEQEEEERAYLLSLVAEAEAREAREAAARTSGAAALAREEEAGPGWDLPPPPPMMDLDLRRELSDEGRALLQRAMSAEDGWITVGRSAAVDSSTPMQPEPLMRTASGELIHRLAAQLADMGFTDSEQNRRALRAHVGKSSDPLAAALEEICQFQGYSVISRG